MSERSSPPILTPDRRLRVFVSSTLKELSAERAAARRAVEEMHMHPVMFELGARPHPPRELYRSYLEQSEIFVGIYWQSYGWIAPGMDISGLEDEFELSHAHPRLIYVKSPAPDREDRLAGMLDAISESGVSYRRFAEPDELCELLRDDLALLITERFSAAVPPDIDGLSIHLPVTTNEFIGRDEDLRRICEMLREPGCRLITIAGPGGIGKSRLAIEAGGALKECFPDGVHLVMLEHTMDAARVPDDLAASLSLPDLRGTRTPEEQVVGTLKEKRMLLILDNFEQVLGAAPFVSNVLASCTGVSAIVTSRSLLKLRGETEYVLGPLEVGPHSDAAKLFEARMHNRELLELPEEVDAIAALTRRLDGLPLAIELAAARTSLLRPSAILHRLDKSFGLLRLESPELPERQRTMRGTIAWSVDLLSEQDIAFFRRLSVFSGGFTLEAAETICDPNGELDALDRMQSLIENSLVLSSRSVFDPRFRMFESIRNYGCELLDAAGEFEEFATRHAEYYLALAETSHSSIRSEKQRETLDLLEAEEANIYSAFSWLVQLKRGEDVVRAGWSIWPFWWMRGRLTDGGSILKAALEDPTLPPASAGRGKALRGALLLFRGDASEAVRYLAEGLDELDTVSDPVGRGFCLVALGLLASVFEAPEQVIARLREAVDVLRPTDETWGTAIALNGLCWMAVVLDVEDVSTDIFEEAVGLARQIGSVGDLGMALSNLGGHLVKSDKARAAELYEESLNLLLNSNLLSGASHTIDKIAEVAVDEGCLDEALVLYGFSEKLRDAGGELLLPAFQARRERFLNIIRSHVDPDRTATLIEQGRCLAFRDGAARALDVTGRVLRGTR